MSMYTNIDDLPQSHNVYDDDVDIQIKEESIKPTIKKKVRFSENFENTENKGFFSKILSQINEDNILLYIILIIASFQFTTRYINYIPFISGYGTNELVQGIIKASVLLVLYIIMKLFVLPQIKL